MIDLTKLATDELVALLRVATYANRLRLHEQRIRAQLQRRTLAEGISLLRHVYDLPQLLPQTDDDRACR